MQNDQWRRIDFIDVIASDCELPIPCSASDCTWDEAAQCFWVLVDSPRDIWLKLQGL